MIRVLNEMFIKLNQEHKDGRFIAVTIVLRYILGLLFMISYIYAQELPSAFINYTVEDGLLSNTTYDLFQDAKGYIWISSDKGVHRFDGSSMLYYDMNNGLSDNDILSIHQDKKGRIWCFPYNGKISFLYKNKVFNSHNDSLVAKLESNSFFSSFLEDSMGNIWLGTRNDGIFKIDTLDHVESFYSRKNFWGDAITVDYMFLDRRGEMYLSRVNYLSRIIADTLQSVYEYTLPDALKRVCYIKDSDFVLFSTSGKIYCLSLSNKKIIWEKAFPGVEKINAIEYLSDGGIYIGTDKGVFSIGKNGKVKTRLLHDRKVSDILIDKEGSLWVSTLYSGVFFLPNQEVVNYQSDSKYIIFRDSNQLYFGGSGLKLQKVNKNGQLEVTLDLSQLSLLSSQDKITALAKNDGNGYWIGTNRGVFLWKESKVELLNSLTCNDLLFKNGILYQAGQRVILAFNHFERKELFSTHQGKLRFFEIGEKKLEEIYGINISRTLCFFQGDELIAGTSNGLLAIEGKNVREKLRSDLSEKINAVAQLSSGELVVMTERAVYQQMNDSMKIIESLSNKAGIKYSSIYIDKNNEIWIGSNKGVFWVTRERDAFEVKQIDLQNGLESSAINDLLVMDDTLWLATMSGITSIPVSSIKNTPPLLYIDSIVSDRQILTGQTLNKVDDNISVHLSGISFKNQHGLEFHYELKGGLTKSGVSFEKKIQLEKLPPAKYTLSIYASTTNGFRSNRELIHFEVIRPWWKHPWLWGGATLVTVLLFVRGIRFNKKKILQHLQENQKKEKERSILIKSSLSGEEIKVLHSEINFIKAAGDYIELHHGAEKTLVRITMKSIFSQLEENTSFIRVHKSYIVNMEKVDRFDKNNIHIFDYTIPISRTKKNQVKDYFTSS